MEATVLGVALEVFGNWVAEKTFDRIYGSLASRRTSLRQELISAVNSALEADPVLKQHCDDTPRVAEEAVRHLEDSALFRACVAGDPQALVSHIQEVDGFSLPGFRGTKADEASLLRGAAAAALTTLLRAVGSDAALLGEFMTWFARQQTADRARQDMKQDQILAHLVKVEEMVAKGGQVVSAMPQTAAQLLVVQDRQEDLVAEIREVLDQQGKEKLDAAKQALDRREIRAVQKAMQDLEGWLRRRGNRASGEVRGRIFMFLADAAVAEEFEASLASAVDTARAWQYQKEAVDAFGGKPSAEDAERLNALTARLMSIDGKDQDALKRLESSDGPYAVSMRMAILLDTGLAAEAADLAERLEPNGRWVHLAIGAAVRAGRLAKAESLLEWALRQEKGTTRPRSVLFYVAERLHGLLVSRFGEAPALPAELLDEDRALLRALAQRLDSVAPLEQHDATAKTGLEVEAHSLRVKLAFLLKDRGLGEAAARAIAEASPIPLEYGQAVLYGFAECPSDLPARLRAERPKSFEAGLVAAYIESDLQTKHEDAFAALKALQPLAVTPDQRERLAAIVHQVSQVLGEDTPRQAQEFVRSLLGDDHRLVRLMSAIELIRDGHAAEAEGALAALADEKDPIWLQARGEIARQKGDWPRAADAFGKAAALVPDPAVLSRAAEAAFRTGRHDLAAQALEAACEVEPRDWRSWWNLALAYSGLARHGLAAEAFGHVAELRPEDAEATLRQAQSLAWSGKLDKAAAVLDTKCQGEQPHLDAVLLRANLLHAAGRPDQAMESIVPLRRFFWDEPQYLLTFLSLGFAANREREGHEALQHLLELQKRGQVSSEYIQPHGIEDVKAWFESRRAFRDEVNRLYLAGRVPWVFVEELGNRATYEGWAFRIQDLSWVSDDPQGRAETTIYATHGFRIVQDPPGHRTLMPIEAPARGGSVVADISALITLHRLELLAPMLRCFDKVLVPDLYRGLALRDGEKLQPHQPSQDKAVSDVLTALDGGKILVRQSSGSTQGQAEAFLCEYSDEAEAGLTIIRLGQLAKWLRGKGMLSDEAFVRVQQVCHAKSIASDDDAEKLLASGTVTAELHTLGTLHGQGLLDTLLRAFRVFLVPRDEREARWNAIGLSYRSQILRWHNELIGFLQNCPQVEFVPVASKEKVAKENTDLALKVHYAMAATQCALDRKLPLLADDRHCQAAAMNAPGDDQVAFLGSDVLVTALAEGDLIDREKQADCLLQLMRWRYRFLVPPAGALVTLAKRHLASPPGEPLREIARYAHASMRDAGLLLGPERTDPPVPMGGKLFLAWLQALGEFAAAVLQDSGIDKESTQKLISWAARECLPGAPPGFSTMARRVFDQAAAASVLGHALIKVQLTKDVQAAHEGLRFLAGQLGISAEEYEECAVETLSAADLALHDIEEKPRRGVLFHLFRIAMGDTEQISFRLLPVAEKLGLVSPGDKLEEPPADELKVLTDPAHPRRVAWGSGPFVFLKNADEAKRTIGVTFMPDTLLSTRVDVRLAGIGFLRKEAAGHFISPRNGALLEECAGAIGEQEAAKWVPAAGRLFASLANDFQLNVAGYRQNWACQHKPGLEQCFPRMMEPSVDSLLSVHDDGYGLLAGTDDLAAAIRQRVTPGASLADFLDCYETLAGHLPLCEPLDLGSQLGKWLDGSKGTAAVWNALWAWAGTGNNPWRKYHACRAMVACPACIPDDKIPEFWDRVLEQASLLGKDPDVPSEVQLWLLRSQLATHYLRYLEANVVAMDPIRIVALAWWAAGKAVDSLTSTLPHTEQAMADVKSWLSGPLVASFQKWGLTWGMTRTSAYCSVPRYVTLNLHQPWAVALLTALGRHVAALPLDRATAGQRAGLSDCLATALMVSPSAVIQPKERSPWEWDRSSHEAAAKWLEALPEDERPERLKLGLSLTGVTATDKAADQLLGLLSAPDAQNKVYVAMMARTLCFCREGLAETVWARLHDGEWWGKCTAGLPTDALGILEDGLTELQSMAGGRWHLEMPYLWLNALEANANDPVRTECLVASLLDSSLAAGTAAPVQRLLGSEHLPKVRSQLVEIRGHLAGMLAVIDRRFAGPTRDMLSALSSL